MKETGTEQYFLLRVKNASLAERIRKALNESGDLGSDMHLNFKDNTTGELKLDGITYPIKALHLPTVVEAFKTYDDIHLVKIGDLGQVLVVCDPNTKIEDLASEIESRDGVTPPMRNARQRHFRPVPTVSPTDIATAERAMLAMMQGYSPMENVEIVDVEEEYDPDLKIWKPVVPPPPTSSSKAAAAAATAANSM
uniref:TAFII55 protein conserved region domain-containing protein n=1 Tax=Polytomella parva TaxID=51329 RepID=A0A7S0YIB8_9CHLO|mmetsp:Transcript_2823/g.4443  ORF Transcript_2823/g.4443 Transcript_2823/m.4443 type:complete len:195 (+) Transcript_2823:57-641(+)